MAGDDLVVATKVRKEFGGLVATDDVDFTIPRGAIVSLIGPNGAGKTTLFNLISRIPFGADRGEVVFDGRRIESLKPHRIFRLGLARTFQKETAFAKLTVEQNIRLGAVFGAVAHAGVVDHGAQRGLGNVLLDLDQGPFGEVGERRLHRAVDGLAFGAAGERPVLALDQRQVAEVVGAADLPRGDSCAPKDLSVEGHVFGGIENSLPNVPIAKFPELLTRQERDPPLPRKRSEDRGRARGLRQQAHGSVSSKTIGRYFRGGSGTTVSAYEASTS